MNYRDWIGRTEAFAERLDPPPARRLAAMLDIEDLPLMEGDLLPPLYHWLYFLPEAPQKKIGADGHPARGDFLPPVTLPRRMFAGSDIRFLAPLRLGALAVRQATVTDVSEKEGRTGKLVFAKVRAVVSVGGKPCIEEVQDIVYRDAGPPAPAPEQKPWPALDAGVYAREITPDPVLLFRYSALTFNGHRIHYDRPYAQNEEGYPGLVVHGPLLATLLADLVRRNDKRPLSAFQFRAEAPVFDLAPFRVIGKTEGASAAVTAQRSDGVTAMRATAQFG